MGVWTIKLFDCYKNWRTFAVSCCPGGICCVQCASAYASSSDDLTKKKARNMACYIAMFLPVCGWVYNRIKVRERLMVQDSVIIDIGFTVCCPCCAATQEFIEALDKNYNRETDMFVFHLLKDSCE